MDTPDPCGLVPHSGAMCLLDKVLEWDEQGILCTASSHSSPANPLRTKGRLRALHGIEYGAQAAAVHGALVANGSRGPRPGYLASVRDVRYSLPFLDQVPTPLLVTARRVTALSAAAMYRVALSTNDKQLVTAQVTIAFPPMSSSPRSEQ